MVPNKQQGQRIAIVNVNGQAVSWGVARMQQLKQRLRKLHVMFSSLNIYRLQRAIALILAGWLV